MSGFKEIALRESCFRPGSTLCPGCMESIALQNVGRVSDNGMKTVFTLGTSCAEVSSLAFPNVVAWGRGDTPPDDFHKSFGIIHNVFESAPTLAEAARDVADLLADHGAFAHPVQVIAASGDGGAFAIGLRSFLHTIYRRSRVTLMVLVNEIFANTGFQYSPATTPFAETSTTPVGEASLGNPRPPLDYIHLAIAAGAGLVAQVSPAHPKLFVKTMEKALACKETAVIFVPAPCISGWKFEDGETVRLATLGAQCGVFPVFVWERGDGGSVKDCPQEVAERPAIEEFLGAQRRFHHLVQKGPDGKFVPRPGKEEAVDRLRTWTQSNVDRLYSLATLH
ncbi:MAG TPA: thiamine pyrophosphate-dependent enzyme [Candidatus Omnitrophota bacterium]|jgi:pyruvate ferredoxin oxidoreductase beta subunit|nr:thiamine pyrophosphate-dependent enzyme [Candidatus Omnitrophota bacterium]